ncbi:MAG: acyl-CoA thioesterase [Actinomycetota bacterium]|nr:acyl-CoA thioesterase [Actinomycetota bacterium]
MASPDRPSIGYTVAVPLRWSDMDAYGHVNNVQFLRLLEDARVIGFEQWFGRGRSLLDHGVLVTRHEIEYLAPLAFRHAPVAVDMWCTKVGAASFDLAYDLRDPDGVGDVTYARAATGVVTYDFDRAAPRRLDPAERAVLEANLGRVQGFRWRSR